MAVRENVWEPQKLGLISGYAKVNEHEKRGLLNICVFQGTDTDENGIKTVYDPHHWFNWVCDTNYTEDVISPHSSLKTLSYN